MVLLLHTTNNLSSVLEEICLLDAGHKMGFHNFSKIFNILTIQELQVAVKPLLVAEFVYVPLGELIEMDGNVPRKMEVGFYM